MEQSEDRVSKRKKAYEYIKGVVCNMVGAPMSISDAELANILGGTIELKDELHALREGKLNPFPRLVNAFKEFVGPTIPESTIDAYLVDPFKAD